MNSLRKYLVNFWLASSTIIVFSSVIMLFIFIFSKGITSISFEFIFSKPSGTPIGVEGGILPAILGSLSFVLVATIASFIAAFSVAIYNQFYSKSRFYSSILSTVISIINGIPSIILGLFGYSFFVLLLNFKISVLSGGLVLAIMIFPNMETRFEKCFSELDQHYKYSALALGVNKFYYILKVVIPVCKREIISITALSASFASGATAPLMLTGAVYYANNPSSIFSPAMSLPTHLYMLLSESVSKDKAFATACVLLILLLIFNLSVYILSSKGRRV